MANREHYNQGTDTFSFGIVLFEILSMNQPTAIEGCRTVDPSQFHICPCWPHSITELMMQSWSSCISERPTMNEVYGVLWSHIVLLDGTAKVRSPQDCDGSFERNSRFDGTGLEKRFSCLQTDAMSSGTLSIGSLSLQSEYLVTESSSSPLILNQSPIALCEVALNH